MVPCLQVFLFMAPFRMSGNAGLLLMDSPFFFYLGNILFLHQIYRLALLDIIVSVGSFLFSFKTLIIPLFSSLWDFCWEVNCQVIGFFFFFFVWNLALSFTTFSILFLFITFHSFTVTCPGDDLLLTLFGFLKLSISGCLRPIQDENISAVISLGKFSMPLFFSRIMNVGPLKKILCFAFFILSMLSFFIWLGYLIVVSSKREILSSAVNLLKL